MLKIHSSSFRGVSRDSSFQDCGAEVKQERSVEREIFDLSDQRVAPLDAGETSEVRIRGCELATMLRGQCSQMCVRDEIGHRLSVAKHLLKDNPMPLRRIHDPCARLIQPALNAGDRLIEGEGVLVHAGIGAQSWSSAFRRRLASTRITADPPPQSARWTLGCCPDSFPHAVPSFGLEYDTVGLAPVFP